LALCTEKPNEKLTRTAKKFNFSTTQQTTARQYSISAVAVESVEATTTCENISLLCGNGKIGKEEDKLDLCC
jgi:hypothetical protein